MSESFFSPEAQYNESTAGVGKEHEANATSDDSNVEDAIVALENFQLSGDFEADVKLILGLVGSESKNSLVDSHEGVIEAILLLKDSVEMQIEEYDLPKDASSDEVAIRNRLFPLILSTINGIVEGYGLPYNDIRDL